MEAILDDGTKFGETEKSLVDRAVRTLADGVMSGMYLQMTLMDIYEMLLQYQEPAAKQLALALERHIKDPLIPLLCRQTYRYRAGLYVMTYRSLISRKKMRA